MWSSVYIRTRLTWWIEWTRSMDWNGFYGNWDIQFWYTTSFSSHNEPFDQLYSEMSYTWGKMNEAKSHLDMLKVDLILPECKIPEITYDMLATAHKEAHDLTKMLF